MRLTARIASITVAAAVGTAALAACTATQAEQTLHPAATQSTASATRTPARATASPTPRLPASPAVQVTGIPSGVKARGAVLVDASTGQVLWSKQANTQRPMASVTKVMTALLVLTSGNLNQPIQVPKAAFDYAWKYGAETAGLHPGDVLTAGQLLEALLLSSGADAAYTLANYYGPGLTAFISDMNAAAARLGMTHTHFTSPDGLPYPTETSTYSTPSDLVTLGLAAMRYPALRSIVDQRFYQLKKGPGHHEYWWDNTDALIGSYQGALGIKDGYTDDAGHCLLFEAERNGRTLIGVALGSPPTGTAAGAQDAEKMLNWGFALRGAS